MWLRDWPHCTWDRQGQHLRPPRNRQNTQAELLLGKPKTFVFDVWPDPKSYPAKNATQGHCVSEVGNVEKLPHSTLHALGLERVKGAGLLFVVNILTRCSNDYDTLLHRRD